jgi:hypothetical protein
VKLQFAAVILSVAVGSVASAAGRPSGFDVWMACRGDIKVVCPHEGLFNLGALKTCMKVNFSQLGPRCQEVVVGHQISRPELASRTDPRRSPQ